MNTLYFSLILSKNICKIMGFACPINQCMVRPLRMAVLLLSVHPLPSQCLPHLHPTHMTDLPMYLPQAPDSDCYQRGGVQRAPLLLSMIIDKPT